MGSYTHSLVVAMPVNYKPTTLIVKELVDYFSQNTDFEESFSAVKEKELDEFKRFKIRSIDEYVQYMDEYVHWVPSETVSGTNVYNHICVFYFILDQPPVQNYQSPIDPSSQSSSSWRWLSDWLIRYAKEMGTWMDRLDSINANTIQTFVDSPAYRDADVTNFYCQYPPPVGGWKTFNEFFARHINLALRPLPTPPSPAVILSPADCTFDGQWAIDDSADVTTFDIKGVPWSIGGLLNDADLGPHFAGGIFTHSFLNTTDYHRQHAPVSGRVVKAEVIPGLCYLEVVLKEVPVDPTSPSDPNGPTQPRLEMHRHIRHHKARTKAAPPAPNHNDGDEPANELIPTAPDSPGYQFIQARGLVLIDSPLGLVAVLPIGMAQVSSVVLSVKAGDWVEKGQEISFFQFGGSDIVMVFQKEARVRLDQEKGVHYKVGSRIGEGQPVRHAPV